jgi:hypothetical protein
LSSLTGVGADGSGSGIGDISLGDDTDLTTVDSPKHLENGLDFGVHESGTGRVGVGLKTVDGHLLSGKESGRRVGRVGDEGVEPEISTVLCPLVILAYEWVI